MATSSADTGSSQTSSSGPRQRARQHDALALAAGELVREQLHLLGRRPVCRNSARLSRRGPGVAHHQVQRARMASPTRRAG